MADWTYQPSEGIPELRNKFQAKLFEKLKLRTVAQHATLITRINTLVRRVCKEFVNSRNEVLFKANIISCYRLWEPDTFLRPWALWEGERAPTEAELELQDGAPRPGVVPEFYWKHVNNNAYEVAVEVLGKYVKMANNVGYGEGLALFSKMCIRAEPHGSGSQRIIEQKMKEMDHSYDISQDINDHIGEVDALIGKWERATGMDMPENQQSAFLLKTLPECWGVMVSTWESRRLPYEELSEIVADYPDSIGCEIVESSHKAMVASMEASKHEAAKVAADHAAFAAGEVKCWGCSGAHRASECPYIDAVKKLNEKGELGELMDLAKKKGVDTAFAKKGPRMKKSLAKRGKQAINTKDAMALMTLMVSLSGSDTGSIEDECEDDHSEDEMETGALALDLTGEREQFLIAEEVEALQSAPTSVSDALNKANEEILMKTRGDSPRLPIDVLISANSDDCHISCLHQESIVDLDSAISDEELSITDFRTVEDLQSVTERAEPANHIAYVHEDGKSRKPISWDTDEGFRAEPTNHIAYVYELGKSVFTSSLHSLLEALKVASTSVLQAVFIGIMVYIGMNYPSTDYKMTAYTTLSVMVAWVCVPNLAGRFASMLGRRGPATAFGISISCYSLVMVLIAVGAMYLAVSGSVGANANPEYAFVSPAVSFGAFGESSTAESYVDFVLDSGASTNATYRSDVMPIMSPSSVSIEDANGRVVTAGGESHITPVVSCVDGTQGALKMNMLYMPSFKHNLLSVKALRDQGHGVYFAPKYGKVQSHISLANGKCIPIKQKGKLFYVRLFFPNSDKALASVSKCQEYHERLGHLSLNRLKRMVKDKLLPGLKKDDIQPFFCDVCAKTKIKQAHFPKVNLKRSTTPMQRQCMDVAGPFKYKGTSGEMYYLLTADDATGWTEITTLDNLAAMTPKIQAHMARLPKLPKMIRLDHAGYFDSKQLKAWAATHNIALEYCQPRRHQQNGCAEATVGAINQVARCMMVHSGLPPKFWPYAVRYASFVRNRCTSASGKSPPLTQVNGKKVNFDLLRTFGCTVYVLNDTETYKLGDKTLEGLFLGYSVDTGGPSVLCLLKNGRIGRFHEVIFKPTSGGTTKLIIDGFSDISDTFLYVFSICLILPCKSVLPWMATCCHSSWTRPFKSGPYTGSSSG